MSSKKPYLSKSRLISAWQCPKKLHLEKHHPELGEVSDQTESLFATGHQVGAIAQQFYGTEDSVEVEFNFKTMEAETRRLIEGGADFPIFEATFRHENVLVRVDVMIPDGDSWRVVEVKASTSVKDYHILDCAIQDWVLRNSGINVTSVSLAHINNQFVYGGDGNYEGLLLENDLTEDVRTLEPTVLELVASAREAVTGPLPNVNVGAQCNKPYECQFINHCWPTDAEYPITGLKGGRAKLAEYVIRGYEDIRDVPATTFPRKHSNEYIGSHALANPRFWKVPRWSLALYPIHATTSTSRRSDRPCLSGRARGRTRLFRSSGRAISTMDRVMALPIACVTRNFSICPANHPCGRSQRR